jgi:hypothetical protein
MRPRYSRRSFLFLLTAAAASPLRTWRPPGQHPMPRPGIDASKVLPASRLEDHPDAVPVFEHARAIPQILDGLRCQCGCSDSPDKYSLLSCFEGDGMASHCEVCQGQTRLAFRLLRLGRTLDEIRDAIEEKYG